MGLPLKASSAKEWGLFASIKSVLPGFRRMQIVRRTERREAEIWMCQQSGSRVQKFPIWMIEYCMGLRTEFLSALCVLKFMSLFSGMCVCRVITGCQQLCFPWCRGNYVLFIKKVQEFVVMLWHWTLQYLMMIKKQILPWGSSYSSVRLQSPRTAVAAPRFCHSSWTIS